MTTRAASHSCRCAQELRNDAELQEGNLGWLKARMAVLIEISADSDAQRQGSALSKLSTDFKGLLASLLEVGECLTCFIENAKEHIPSANLQFTHLVRENRFKTIVCNQM